MLAASPSADSRDGDCAAPASVGNADWERGRVGVDTLLLPSLPLPEASTVATGGLKPPRKALGAGDTSATAAVALVLRRFAAATSTRRSASEPCNANSWVVAKAWNSVLRHLPVSLCFQDWHTVEDLLYV